MIWHLLAFSCSGFGAGALGAMLRGFVGERCPSGFIPSLRGRDVTTRLYSYNGLSTAKQLPTASQVVELERKGVLAPWT